MESTGSEPAEIESLWHHDLSQEARAAAGVLLAEAAARPVDDPWSVEEALSLLPPLEDADLFLTGLLLLWSESDRWSARPREARPVHGARCVIEWLDRRLPQGPLAGGGLPAPELVARAFQRIQEALPGIELSPLLARLPEARELLAAAAAPEDDGRDRFPSAAAAPEPVPAEPGAAVAVERDLTDFADRRLRGEWWTSQHVTSLVLRILGLPPSERPHLLSQALALARAFADDDQGWWTSRVVVDAARCLAHLPGPVEPLIALLDPVCEAIGLESDRFEALEEIAVAWAAHGREGEARSRLDRITDDHHLAGAACHTARALAAAAQPAAAERLFRLALESARCATAVGRPSREAEVLHALAACGRPAAARLAALSFRDVARRARALSAVAAALLDRAAPAEAFRCLVLLLTSPRVSPVLNGDALARIARGLAAQGQGARARKLLTRALATAAALPDPEAREPQLQTLATAALEPADLGRSTALRTAVLKSALALEDPLRRDNLLEHIAACLVRAGRSDDALALEDSFSSPWRKAQLLALAGEAAVSAGDAERGAGLFGRALGHLEGQPPDAGSIPSQAAFVPALFTVPDPALRRPLLLRAIEQVAAHETDTTRAYALVHLAKTIAGVDRSGDHGDLLAVAADQCDRAEMPSEATSVRIEAARLFARAGDARQALELAQRLWSVQGHQDIARAAAVAGFADTGHYGEALEELGRFKWTHSRDRALLAVASSLAALAPERRPDGLVEELLDAAQSASDAEKRAEATMALAPLLPPGAPRAAEALAGIEEEMYTLPTRNSRANVLTRLVEAWVVRGDVPRALAILWRADAGGMGAAALAALCRSAPPADLEPLTGPLRELLADFDEPRARAEGLVDLGRVLARGGRRDEALRALTDAAAALAIAEPLSRHIALEKIAACLDEEALAGPAELYRTLLEAACGSPAWNQAEAVANVGQALARLPDADAGLCRMLEEIPLSSPARRRLVQTWRTALLTVHPSPRPMLRRTLSLFPQEAGLGPEGVQCLAAAHLQEGDIAAFEALVRACPGILEGRPARALPG